MYNSDALTWAQMESNEEVEVHLYCLDVLHNLPYLHSIENMIKKL
jgi:hypothetical protein